MMGRAGGDTYRILIIEDNEGDIMLLREALQAAGIAGDVVAFDDGEKALRHISEVSRGQAPAPDAIILDMHLPRVEATAILAAMQKNALLARTPTLVLSSSISPEDRRRIEAYSVARHIVKPGDLDEFLKIGETVRELLPEGNRESS